MIGMILLFIIVPFFFVQLLGWNSVVERNIPSTVIKSQSVVGYVNCHKEEDQLTLEKEIREC